MKFKISKERFVDGLQKVQHVVNTRTTLPILSNVLMVARGGQLHLTTTDLDVGITGAVSATIEKEGETTLPAKRLLSIIRELPASEVTVTVDAKNVAKIESGPATFNIIGLSAEEFPPLPDFAEAKEFEIDEKLLRDGLKKTSYAISTDETRYVLNGIFASFKEGKMIFVATDGRRLAMMDADLEFPESSETEVIIPNKAIQELQRLAVGDGKVEMKLSASQASFTIADTLVVSKLIEGNYPNYRQVIPADPEEKVEVDREHLFETVRRISLLASDKTNSVKLAFRPGEIEVSVDSPDVGAANEKIDVPYDGKEMQIAFNPEFLMAPLRSLDSQTVVFNLIDEMSPGVIRVPSDTGGFLYVLMPMRVSG